MKFQFKIKCWAHQLKEFLETKDFRAWGLLWQMRTGKTKVIIDTAMYLFLENKLDVVLIITRSGVHSNWIRKEVPKHCSIPYDAAWWEADNFKKTAYRTRLQNLVRCESLIFFAINNESFILPKAQQYMRHLLKLRVMLVVDEVHDFRGHDSKRAKLARAIAKHCAYIRILTGTNIGNCPLGNWSQFEILKEAALGFEKYRKFEQYYALLGLGETSTGKMYQTIDGYRNLEEMQKTIDALSSTITRKECPDLPPLVISTVDVKLSPEQRRVYRQLKKDFITELHDGGSLEIAEAGVRRIKLQQILSNFTIDAHGVLHTIDPKHNPRMDVLMDHLGDADGKVIVWCKFKWDLTEVAQRLNINMIPFVEYHGSIKKADRFEAERKFRDDPTYTVFLGQPQAAGLGLDLSAASTIIWYSHIDDKVIRDQANERATEKGSTAVGVIDLVVPNSIDEDILDGHRRKASISDFMTDSRQSWRDRMREALEKDTV